MEKQGRSYIFNKESDQEEDGVSLVGLMEVRAGSGVYVELAKGPDGEPHVLPLPLMRLTKAELREKAKRAGGFKEIINN